MGQWVREVGRGGRSRASWMESSSTWASCVCKSAARAASGEESLPRLCTLALWRTATSTSMHALLRSVAACTYGSAAVQALIFAVTSTHARTLSLVRVGASTHARLRAGGRKGLHRMGFFERRKVGGSLASVILCMEYALLSTFSLWGRYRT